MIGGARARLPPATISGGLTYPPQPDCGFSVRRKKLRFAADLYGAFPVKQLFWVLLPVLCVDAGLTVTPGDMTCRPFGAALEVIDGRCDGMPRWDDIERHNPSSDSKKRLMEEFYATGGVSISQNRQRRAIMCRGFAGVLPDAWA